MGFVNLNGVSTAFGSRDVLLDVNLNISESSRIALAGANGSGKSTLLKIIAGLAKQDSGTVSVQKNTRISYLPQSGIVFKGLTLYKEAEKAFSVFDSLEKKMKHIEHQLSDVEKKDSAAYSLLEEHHEIHEKIISGGYYEREKEIERILTGLGFAKKDFSRMTHEFSGGWQMRIALAVILLEKPEIMLLDEPTNYLDIEARDWLEEFIVKFSGGVVIVSHDRYFLDVTCSEVVELFKGKLNRYKGNYSKYETVRAQELETLVDKYKKQQEEIERIEYFIRKFRSNSSKAALVQSRIKYLEGIEIIEIPEHLKKMHFRFPSPPHSGRDVLNIENLNREFDSIKALKDVSLNIRRGEKIALAGKNGAGKTTLLRILAGQDTGFTGTVRYGKDVSTGYFSQDFEETITDDNTVIDEVESVSKTEQYPLLRSLLGAFLFRGDDIYKKISVLSGGEKNRIALLKLLLHPVNLLILDEPTNHLDMNSKDILLEALKDYSGTLIFVSHDRYFIEKLADRVIELDAGTANDYPGNFEYYLWKKKSLQDAAQPPPAQAAGTITNRGSRTGSSELTDSASFREKGKEIKRGKRKLERRAHEILASLDELMENALKIEHDMGLEKNYTDGNTIKELKEKLEQNNKKQADFTAEWEIVETQLAAIEQQGGE